MASLTVSLGVLMQVDGAIAAAVVDMETGMCLGSTGNSLLNLDVAAAGTTEVMRAKMAIIKDLELKDEIEDILITLGMQYHILRPIKAKGVAGLFVYFVLDKSRANLALARRKVTEITKA